MGIGGRIGFELSRCVCLNEARAREEDVLALGGRAGVFQFLGVDLVQATFLSFVASHCGEVAGASGKQFNNNNPKKITSQPSHGVLIWDSL